MLPPNIEESNRQTDIRIVCRRYSIPKGFYAVFIIPYRPSFVKQSPLNIHQSIDFPRVP